MSNLSACFSSNSDEWETPQNLFDELNREFNFDLDVCATSDNHKCPVYFTKEDNGLSKNWGGTECGLTRLILKLINGLRKHTEKQGMITQLLLC